MLVHPRVYLAGNFELHAQYIGTACFDNQMNEWYPLLYVGRENAFETVNKKTNRATRSSLWSLIKSKVEQIRRAWRFVWNIFAYGWPCIGLYTWVLSWHSKGALLYQWFPQRTLIQFLQCF